MQAGGTPRPPATQKDAARHLVLVGGGHSHVGVLRSFGETPQPAVRLTLICTDMQTPYSGMLPGYVAGHYRHDEVHIDLPRLAAFAGATLRHDAVIGIDRSVRQVLCRSSPPIHYDFLSINIGSTPQVARVPGASEHSVPVKPIAQFNQRWLALLDRVRSHAGMTTIAVVGGGAGGVELLLAMQFRLRGELRALGRDPDDLRFHLVTQSADLMPTHNAGVRRRFRTVLAARGVTLHLNTAVTEVGAGRLKTQHGPVIEADEIIWVTQAGGAAWLPATGLKLDDGGFIAVNDELQSVSDARIFAAGDIAAMVNHPLEKAGVFAVRQARPLADNLRASALGQPLASYRPQRKWLALVSTGDRHAVASRGAVGFAGDWVWRWKDWIDRRFMRRFSKLPGLPPAARGESVVD
jgi:selenide, water dikinase